MRISGIKQFLTISYWCEPLWDENTFYIESDMIGRLILPLPSI